MHALHLPQDIAGELEKILRKSGMHYNIYADEKMYFSTFGQQFLDYARHIGVEPWLRLMDWARWLSPNSAYLMNRNQFRHCSSKLQPNLVMPCIQSLPTDDFWKSVILWRKKLWFAAIGPTFGHCPARCGSHWG